MQSSYLFKSERLGFRNWEDSDLPNMIKINADPEVMEFFPSLPSPKQTAAFIERMKQQFSENGFCYFAVDQLETKEFIGFIGIARQSFEADFTPCVDIGWRLARSAWNKGFATEGAKRCLDFAFKELALNNIKSICPIINIKSERVMKKIGLKKVKTFNHPLLKDHKNLEKCVLYEIDKE